MRAPICYNRPGAGRSGSEQTLAKAARARQPIAEKDELQRGRGACRDRAWADAFRLLSLADQAEPLSGPDLELLALAAGLSGRDDEFLRAFERAHQFYVDNGE